MTTSILAIGSNLGDRHAHMHHALSRIRNLSAISLDTASTLYETAPVGGPDDQGAYLNAAVLVQTELSALDLLAAVRAIEAERQRERVIRWGPRTLDIDVLTFGDAIRDDPVLTLPHPRMHERRFVMVPVCDVAPDTIHPRLGRTMRDLLAYLPVEPGDLTPIDTEWAAIALLSSE